MCLIILALAGCNGQAPTATPAPTATSTNVPLPTQTATTHTQNAGVTVISNVYGEIKFGNTTIQSTSEIVISVDVFFEGQIPSGASLTILQIRTENLQEWATIEASGGGLVTFIAREDMPLITPIVTLSDGSTVTIDGGTLEAGVPMEFSAGNIWVVPFDSGDGQGFPLQEA